MRTRFSSAVVVLGVLAVCVVAAASAIAAGKTAVIRTKGRESFAPNPANPPNKLDVDSLQWLPGTITVHSGEKLKLIDSDNSGDPHVLAIALKKDLPKNENINNNPVVRKIAPKLLVNPANPDEGFKAYRTNSGKNGLNQEGDSLVILPGGPHKSATWFVSAKPGTTLYYFCAVHPWMQGEIRVVK